MSAMFHLVGRESSAHVAGPRPEFPIPYITEGGHQMILLLPRNLTPARHGCPVPGRCARAGGGERNVSFPRERFVAVSHDVKPKVHEDEHLLAKSNVRTGPPSSRSFLSSSPLSLSLSFRCSFSSPHGDKMAMQRSHILQDGRYVPLATQR